MANNNAVAHLHAADRSTAYVHAHDQLNTLLLQAVGTLVGMILLEVVPIADILADILADVVGMPRLADLMGATG